MTALAPLVSNTPASDCFDWLRADDLRFDVDTMHELEAAGASATLATVLDALDWLVLERVVARAGCGGAGRVILGAGVGRGIARRTRALTVVVSRTAARPTEESMQERITMPGIRPKVLGESLCATFEGGTLGDQVLTLSLVCTGTCSPADQTITMAIEAATGAAFQPVTVLELSFKGQMTYDESEGLAKRVALSRHLETYRFSHWQKPQKRFARKMPVYRFVHARQLIPRPGMYRWGLEVGAEIPLPERREPMLKVAGTWIEARAQVTAAADAFHRAANLLTPFGVEAQLSQPRKVVEDCRAQADLWAKMGEELDGLPPGEKRTEAQQDLMGRIIGARQLIEECVVLVAEVVAKAPAAYDISARCEDGAIDLMALLAGTDAAAQLG